MQRKNKPWILGLSASHNGGACLLRGNEIVVAIQEERLTGLKRARVFGAKEHLSVRYCLDHAGIAASDLDVVVVATQGRTKAREQDILYNPQLQVGRNSPRVLTISHHLGHAVSAYALSGFREASILVVDGVGSPAEDFSPAERSAIVGTVEDGWEHVSMYAARNRSIKPLRKYVVERGQWLCQRASGMATFGSIGGMYSACALQIFGDALEAGQVMGLAPFGRAIHSPRDFFAIRDTGFVFRDIVPKCYRRNRWWPQCKRSYEDLAASVQAALQVAIKHLATVLRNLNSSENLCYAGGVALNGNVNEALHRSSLFKRVFVPPAAEDSGVAIGAAFYGLWQTTRQFKPRELLSDALGHRYTNEDTSQAVKTMRRMVRQRGGASLVAETADRMSSGQICGWFDAGSEFGPRALGNRSILADPRDIKTKMYLNEVVKQRATFRPFAPSIAEENAPRFVDDAENEFTSPFMLRVSNFTAKAQAILPAVTHVDGTARVHTVNRLSNPRLYQVIRAFEGKTGVPVLLNTSFNAKGEPIVETPEDALWCFYFLRLDFCILQDTLVERRSDLCPLDFYPQLIAPGYTIVVDRTARADKGTIGTTQAILQFETRWGRAEQQITPHDFRLLRAIDGTRNGWQLLDVLRKKDSTLTETAIAGGLLRLRRASAVAMNLRSKRGMRRSYE